MRNRLHALCPYFAMFPEHFVTQHVANLTQEGDHVLDPFSGRGTTALQSLLMGRNATAIDINPVGYCVSGAKAQVPSLDSVSSELGELKVRYRQADTKILDEERYELPDFFGRAFNYSTLNQLLFLRNTLNWHHDIVHRFIVALILGTLHGEMDRSQRYLSNQMPRTISPKPAYSLRYWQQRNLWPKKKDVFDNLQREATLRLSGVIPALRGSSLLADARTASTRLPHLVERVSAVITSPPYFDVTNFEEDQWLRLWFLGNQPRATYRQISKDDRHSKKGSYWEFLAEVWKSLSPLMRPGAKLVCRIGGKGMDQYELTSGLMQTLTAGFPDLQVLSPPVITSQRKRQTTAFRPGSVGCGFEVDHVFQLSRPVE